MTQSFFFIRQKEEALSFFINLIILDFQKTKLNYTLVTCKGKGPKFIRTGPWAYESPS